MPKAAKNFAADPLKSVIDVFDRVFGAVYHTRLVGGAPEPLYKPRQHDTEYSSIIFTRDYLSSALHECAHWCVAGPIRRMQLDYGYWYAPDGRDSAQQKAFEQVEVKPQALERIFAYACGHSFRISADNLAKEQGPSENFIKKVQEQTIRYCNEGLPSRALAFVEALSESFAIDEPLNPQNYSLEQLRGRSFE